MASTLLVNSGLPYLVTHSMQEFEELAGKQAHPVSLTSRLVVVVHLLFVPFFTLFFPSQLHAPAHTFLVVVQLHRNADSPATALQCSDTLNVRCFASTHRVTRSLPTIHPVHELHFDVLYLASFAEPAPVRAAGPAPSPAALRACATRCRP